MHITSALPPPPPNFAKSPEEILRNGIDVVVERLSPTLRISVTTAIGSIPLYFDMPLPVGMGRYGEF